MRDNNPFSTTRQDVSKAAVTSDKYFHAAGQKIKSPQTALRRFSM
jgi:hypothetical protein